jgi:hypothetical protein
MRTALMVCVFALCVQLSKAQVALDWCQSCPGGSNAFALDDSGNTYSTGTINSYLPDVRTMKCDRSGNLRWVSTWNGPWDTTDVGLAVTADRSGNAYVLCAEERWRYPNGYEDNYHVIKYDSEGNLGWVATIDFAPMDSWEGIDTDKPYAIAVDGAGNTYVALKGIDFIRQQIDSTYWQTVAINRLILAKITHGGTVQWKNVYGTGMTAVGCIGFRVDTEGNSYLVLKQGHGYDYPATADIAVHKVLTGGEDEWLNTYPYQPGKNRMERCAMTLDRRGNVYVGLAEGLGLTGESCLMKLNSAGVHQWTSVGTTDAWFDRLVADDHGGVYALGSLLFMNSTTYHPPYIWRYDSTGTIAGTNSEIAPGGGGWYRFYHGAVDTSGFLYVARGDYGPGDKYATAKVGPTGRTEWMYSRPAGWYKGITRGIGVDDSGNVYIGATAAGMRVEKLTQFCVYRPAAHEKWISGEIDTIRWRDPGWATKDVSCIVNVGRSKQETIPVAEGITADSTFAWQIPDTLLSYRSKIIISDAADPSRTIRSDTFKLKPYRLTKVKPDSTYEPFRVEVDRWGFGNTRNEMWPEGYWSGRIDYQGIDPFTNLQYSQTQEPAVFAASRADAFPDWPSFVRAFGVSECYRNPEAGVYNPIAMQRWWDVSGNWKGSCFGIAAANALAFAEGANFQFHYPSFPSFNLPVEVAANSNVIDVVTSLVAQQFGKPTTDNDKAVWAKTPNQTVVDLKAMLREDTVYIRTLSFYNNNGPGGHTITPHWLEKEPGNNPFYRANVWDNSFPTVLDASIVIDTLGNGGNGIWWATHGWGGWGGWGRLFLEVPSHEYFSGAMFPKSSLARSNPVRTSPFALSDSGVEVLGFKQAGIVIQDGSGNLTGVVNGAVLADIPGSVPLQVRDGSETPPYGYHLLQGGYQVTLDSAGSERLGMSLYTGKRVLSYHRRDAQSHQRDRIVYGGGMRLVNPDAEAKNITLLAITGEASQDKLFALRGLTLAQADSLSIDNRDSTCLVFRSYGSSRLYDLEVNVTSAGGMGRFVASGIQIGANSGHTIAPAWSDLVYTPVTILVDEGNDGSVDDTLTIANSALDVGGRKIDEAPREYLLSQNYPNPFNAATTIRYGLPQKTTVRISLYSPLGQEVAVLVAGEREAGYHVVRVDGSRLASGVYYYRMQAGPFSRTMRMVLIK